MVVNYKEISDKAYLLHSQNRLDEAESLYIKLLDVSPEDVNVLNLYGLLLIAKGNFDKAISLLSRAVVLKDSAYILNNLAKAYLSNNEIGNAIKLFEKAIEKKPDDDMYYSLAIAYKKNNNIYKAIYCYEKALEYNPSNYNACYNISIAYSDIKDNNKAIEYAKKCLFIKPGAEEIYTMLSSLYEETGQIEESIECLEKAVVINPCEYLYYYNLGVLYSKIENEEKSILNYLKVLSLKPNSVETLVNLCTLYKNKNKDLALKYILKAQKIAPYEKNVLLNLAQLYRDLFRNEESIAILNKMIQSDSSLHEAYSLLGMNYMDECEYQKALEFYNKAIELMPENTNYLHGKAVALKYCGNIAESKKLLEYILKLNPEEKQTEIILGMMYLTEKNFKKGMELYRQRNQDTKFSEVFKDKCWEPGIEIKNKNVLVYSNCGLGDTIMYARYLNRLKDIASKVVLQTDKTLVNIIASNFPEIEVIEKSKTPPFSYDTVLSVMDLQYALNQDFLSIPLSEGYIKPDFKLVSNFADKDIFNTDKKKIGLFWQGNRKIFKNRSLNFSMFSEVLNLDNFKFYSFQIDENDVSNDKLINLKKYINNYDDTAALLSKMDLLISIDSSIVHMAGAMELNTILLLPYTAEWRWFNDSETTPWYNSIKILRQTQSGNWNDVISRLKDELMNL